MSKRSLKKQQKRQASALEDLEESLGCGDLGQTERLLQTIRRSGGGSHPLAALAEAVLDLAAGRCTAAQVRLAGLEGAEPIPEGLLPALHDLASKPDHPYPRAARKLFAALEDADRKAVARGVQALRANAPADVAQDEGLRRLLDGADQLSSQHTALHAFEARLARRTKRSRLPASEEAAAWLRGPGARLAVLLTAPGPPLLAPLRHALRLRWRTVLERVADQEGAAGLAALCLADPKLLAHDADLPGGVQAGSTALRQHAQARQLLAEHRYGELAELLQSRSRTVSDPSSLAAAWSLELWARERQEIDEESDDKETEPPPHKSLVRLQQMAGEIGRRFPSAHRTEVARVLRGALVDLGEQIPFCGHMAGTALFLLEHLPGDAVLLLTGLAGAAAAQDTRALRVFQTAARDRKVQAADRAAVDRLMVQVAQEAPDKAARILDAVRPLFTEDDWPRTASLVARELAGTFADVLREMGQDAIQHPDLDFTPEIRATLDLFRPALAGTHGFAAAELGLDCWRKRPSAVESRLKRFLAEVPGVEGPLAAFRLLEMANGPWAPAGLTGPSLLADAIIDRIAEDWPLWYREAPILAIAADDAHRRLLEHKTRQLLLSPSLREEDREKLRPVLAAIQEIAQLRTLLQGGPRRRRPKPGKPRKARRKPAASPQLELDLP